MISISRSRFRLSNRERRFLQKGATLFVAFSVLVVAASFRFGDVLRNQKPAYFVTEQVVEGPLRGRLLFNDAPNSTALSESIVSVILQAEHSAEMGMYSFKHEGIRQALLKSFQAGKVVHLVLERSNHLQHERFLGEYDLPVTELGSSIGAEQGDYVHHKFLLSDRGERGAQLLVGSLNYTPLQEQYDPSFLLHTADPTVLEAFSAEFALLERRVRGRSKLRQPGYRPLSKRLRYSNGLLEVWFGPGIGGNSVKHRLIGTCQR